MLICGNPWTPKLLLFGNKDALAAIQQSESAKEITELTDYEKAIIYAYTYECYAINAKLRHV